MQFFWNCSFKREIFAVGCLRLFISYWDINVSCFWFNMCFCPLENMFPLTYQYLYVAYTIKILWDLWNKLMPFSCWCWILFGKAIYMDYICFGHFSKNLLNRFLKVSKTTIFTVSERQSVTIEVIIFFNIENIIFAANA